MTHDMFDTLEAGGVELTSFIAQIVRVLADDLLDLQDSIRRVDDHLDDDYDG